MAEKKYDERLYSEEEYLALDSELDKKYEFFDGRIVAMAGASQKHASIVGQAVTALNNRLVETTCQASSSDLRVQLEGSLNYVYPDVVVWCEGARWAAKLDGTLLTPSIVIEVLSTSTGNRDTGYKLELYKRITSLKDYLIVSQNRVYVEHYRRSSEGERWDNFSYYRREQIIQLGFHDLELPVGELYRRVDVPEQLLLMEDSN